MSRVNFAGHVAITRPDHWFKNAFVLPGILIALFLQGPVEFTWTELGVRCVLGSVAVCLIVASYYTLNELLDAEHDRAHPKKRNRPVPLGQVNVKLGYVQWFGLGLLGLGVGRLVSLHYAGTLFALWCAAALYNLPPIRTKDVPYLDVLTEAVNNPLRMLAGWYLVTDHALPPASLLSSYWLVGGYFMALKRYAEIRSIDDAAVAGRYRKSFRFYTPERLLVLALTLLVASVLFLGVFVARYRLELVLALPAVALVLGEYLRLALLPDSPVEAPERLYRQPWLMLWVLVCCAMLAVLLWWDWPALHEWLQPQFQ